MGRCFGRCGNDVFNGGSVSNSTIINSTFTDTNETVDNVGDSGANLDLDYSLGSLKRITLTDNVTLTISNPPSEGGSMLLEITQDVVGSRLVTFPASVKWQGGTTPTLSTVAGAVDLISLVTFDGGVTWYGDSGTDYS